MKISKSLLWILLILVTAGIAIGLFAQAQAQKQKVEGIIQYLEQRFAQENIPVREITILSESPLRLEIIIQSTSDFETPDDFMNVHKMDRDVFVLARLHDYIVDSYVRIMVNPQGRQTDYLEQDSKFKYIPIDTSPSHLPDAVALGMARDKINALIDKYDLRQISVINTDVSSSEGFQTLTLQLEAASLEEANKALALTQPMYPMLKEINAQGAQIAVYHVLIKDKEGDLLVNYLYDLQLEYESIRMDKSLDSSGIFPAPAPAP